MTTPLGAALLLRSCPLEEPQPFSVSYGGLEYTGEAVLLDHWDPVWGRALEGDVYFRIVLLWHRRQVPSSDVQDSRIAVCIPSRGPARGGGQVGRELTALRETQVLYRTGKDPSSVPIQRYLRGQQEDLEGQLLGEEAARYAGGHIESPTNFSGGLCDIFAGPEPGIWIQRISDALLSWAYPDLAINSSLIPRSLSPGEVSRVYDAIFASTLEGKAPLGEFGPALGLSTPREPLTFEPSGCRAFGDIRAELEASQDGLAWNDVQRILAHAWGLTRPLATLYLLAFVYYGRPETELGMSSHHQLKFRDHRPVRGSRLTREFLPLLPWQDDLFEEKIVRLRLLGDEVTWNDALQYTSLLCQGLNEQEEGDQEISSQERELLEALHELSRDVARGEDVLEKLSVVVPNPHKEEQRSSLLRLSSTCDGNNFREVYRLARDAYDNPQDVLQGLTLVKRLLYLGGSLEDILSVKAYMDGASIQEGQRQLSFDRSALLEEMSVQVFLAGDQAWPTMREHFRQFQVRYSRAYADYHTHYQREASHHSASLEGSRQKLHALALLNSIPELGEPLGSDLVQRCLDLEQSIKLCDIDSSELPLERSPTCEGCILALGEADSGQELEIFLRDLDRALEEQNRRLSRTLVERILQDKVDRQLEGLLKIVQASDLSALSNTLNHELALFIQQILRGP